MTDTIQYTNFQVARGVIRIPASITGRKAHGFAKKGEFLRPGDAIPEGMLSDRELRSLLASGIVKEIDTPRRAQAAQEAARRHMSRWSVDPATLGRKSLEDLLVMIQEIDPEYPLDQVQDEDAARRLLSKDFDPDFREDPADVLARDPVSRLTASGVKDSGKGPLSQKAASALAELQARAETPEAKGGADDQEDSEVSLDDASQEDSQG